MCEGASIRARSFQPLVMAVIALISAGCHDSRPPSDGQPVAVTEPCSPPPQLPLIFYDDNGTPSDKTPVLSKPELSQIVSAVAVQTADPIWLIRVRPSEGDQRNTVTAYSASQKQTPRTRQGRAFDVWISAREVRVYPLEDYYIQVSSPAQPFGGSLTLPSRSNLPFSWPTVADPDTKATSPMSEEEIVGIVDFVRQPSIYKSVGGWPRSEREWMTRQAQELPILEIEGYRNTIHVTLGYMHGALWGYGQHVTLKRTRTGYRIVDWTLWIS